MEEQAGAEVWLRYSGALSAAEVQPRCSQGAAEVQPRGLGAPPSAPAAVESASEQVSDREEPDKRRRVRRQGAGRPAASRRAEQQCTRRYGDGTRGAERRRVEAARPHSGRERSKPRREQRTTRPVVQVEGCERVEPGRAGTLRGEVLRGHAGGREQQQQRRGRCGHLSQPPLGEERLGEQGGEGERGGKRREVAAVQHMWRDSGLCEMLVLITADFGHNFHIIAETQRAQKVAGMA